MQVCSVMSKSLQPYGLQLPRSSVHGISRARILEWVAISSSRGSSWPKDRTHVSGVSCISRWIIYHWTTWKAHLYLCLYLFCPSVLFIWRTLTHTTNSNLKIQSRDFLVVQWLWICTFTAGSMGSIPGQVTKILHAAVRFPPPHPSPIKKIQSPSDWNYTSMAGEISLY